MYDKTLGLKEKQFDFSTFAIIRNLIEE